MDFTGKRMTHVKPNPEGGPCGTPHEAKAPH
jgi:hypothetical protein